MILTKKRYTEIFQCYAKEEIQYECDFGCMMAETLNGTLTSAGGRLPVISPPKGRFYAAKNTHSHYLATRKMNLIVDLGIKSSTYSAVWLGS